LYTSKILGFAPLASVDVDAVADEPVRALSWLRRL
jgi:hypothetical protein